MTRYRRVTLSLLAAAFISIGIAGTGWAGEPRSDVVGQVDIQAQIDRKIDNESADRQAIRDLLRRPEVRRIAGAAGLDIERATAAAGVLSGPELKDIAARAHELNAGIGGTQTVTLSVTAIVIIVLLIILIAN
jgi:hypothetical protein